MIFGFLDPKNIYLDTLLNKFEKEKWVLEPIKKIDKTRGSTTSGQNVNFQTAITQKRKIIEQKFQLDSSLIHNAYNISKNKANWRGKGVHIG